MAGVGLGVTLSVAYLAGGAARTAANQEPTVHVALEAPPAKSSYATTPRAVAPAATPVSLRGPAPQPATPSIGRPHGVGSLDCLTAAVYYEARGESDRGQQAVAQVVLNRVRRAGFPKSVCGVVFQGVADHSCQFSFACDGSMHQGREPAAWRRAHAVAQHALDGFVMEEVGDATNFHVANLGRIWGSGLVKVAQVGAHVFYKLTNHGTFAVHDSAAPPATPASPETGIPADGGSRPSLILASAVGVKPLGQGGPIGPVSEPASAPAAATPAPAPAKASTPAAKTTPAAATAAVVSTAPKADS